jgi:hypothetical protein
MASFFKRKPVRIFLSCFRWCRVIVLLTIFLIIAGVTYLHLLGLPESLKRPLLRHLREKGFEAEFSTMHLGWGPALVIDNVAFRRADQPSGARLSAGVAEMAVNLRALLHSRLEVDSFAVSGGRLEFPLSETNGDLLLLDDVRLQVALLSNNVAQLRNTTAVFRGIQISARGEISNFQSLRDWRFPFRFGQKSHAGFPEQLRRAAEIIRQIHFAGAPRLNVDFVANGADMNSLRASLGFTAEQPNTPWGSAARIELRAACAHLLDSGVSPFVQVRFNGERVTCPKGAARNLSFVADLSRDASTNFNASIDVTGNNIEAKWESRAGSNYWVHAGNAQWEGEATLFSTNFMPASLGGTLRLLRGDSSWGTAVSLSLTTQVRRDAAPAPARPVWGAWNFIAPYSIDWQAAGAGVSAPKLQLEEIALEGRWRAPRMTVQKLQAQLYHGHVDGQADLDVDSRELRVETALDFDVHQLAPLLTQAAQRFFSQFDWPTPPRAQGGLRLVLPPWIDRPENWKTDFRSSVALAGDFSAGTVSFRGISVESAASHFTYTNRVWTVPGLRAKRADGDFRMDYEGNEETHEYHFIVDSTLDPADVFDWIPAGQQPLAREIKFSKTPEIHGEASGRWRNKDTFAFSGTVAASNFTVRGQNIEAVEARLEYTNHNLRVTGLRLAQGGGALSASLLAADLDTKTVVLTNIDSTLDPRLLPPIFGSNTPPFLQRLYFETAPSLHAFGSFVWTNALATDLTFLVQGQNFHWTNLTAEKISGAVRWLGRDVAVTNIQASLYKTGALDGWIVFDYVPKHGSSFRCDFSVRDIDLPALAKGVTGKTNKLEGLLDGRLTLSSPLSTDKNTLEGRGHVYLHDALLWDIKMFGIFSPILNTLSPGAGYSRARSASAIFAVANGAVSSDDLEVTSTGFRLLYRGKVGMNKQIDGRVEADLLRDTPVLGPFLSFVLTPLSKIFEYHITGTLRNPVIEPLYIPKAFMMLLRPFHTLKSLMPESSAETPSALPILPP